MSLLEGSPELIMLGSIRLEDGSSLGQVMNTMEGFLESVREGYASDALLSKIRDNPDQFSRFRISDGLLYMDRADAHCRCYVYRERCTDLAS